MARKKKADAEQSPAKDSLDLDELSMEFVNDPILIHSVRMLVLAENGTIFAGKDGKCLDCLGEKLLPASEHLPEDKHIDRLCALCGGSGSIVRT